MEGDGCYPGVEVSWGGLYINDFNYWGVRAGGGAGGCAMSGETGAGLARFESGKLRRADVVRWGGDGQSKGYDRGRRIQRYTIKYGGDQRELPRGVQQRAGAGGIGRVASQVLPRQYSFEWTDLALPGGAAGNTALFIFPLCILFVWRRTQRSMRVSRCRRGAYLDRGQCGLHLRDRGGVADEDG